MKRLTAIIALALIAIAAAAQTPKDVKYVFTEATDLNLIGKIIDTPNPYHRVDTVKYKGFTKGENEQVRSSAGLAVLFKTNSSVISVLADYGYMNRATNTMGISLRGYDLYIKKDGEWPFTVFLDVEVVASERNAHCVGRTVHVSVIREDGDH